MDAQAFVRERPAQPDRPVEDLANLHTRRRDVVIEPCVGRAPGAELPPRCRVGPGLEVDSPDTRPRRENLDVGPDRRQLRWGWGFGELRHGSGQLSRKGGDSLGRPTLEQPSTRGHRSLVLSRHEIGVREPEPSRHGDRRRSRRQARADRAPPGELAPSGELEHRQLP